MIINKYKFNKKCEEVINEWENGLSSHLLLNIPINRGVKEDIFLIRLADIFNKINKSKRKIDESYLYLKYSKDMNEYKRKLFFDSPSVIAKNYNSFNGVFVIDISEWIDSIYSQGFRELLEYIGKNSRNMKFVFVIAENDKEKYMNLVDLLSEVIYMNEIKMTYPDIEYFMIYLESILNSKDIDIDQYRTKLVDLLECFYHAEEFQGYDTIDRLAENIIYMMMKYKTIDFDKLYKSKTKKNEREKQYIGF